VSVYWLVCTGGCVLVGVYVFLKLYFILYCVLVRVTVYVGCLSGVINDDDLHNQTTRLSDHCGLSECIY